MAYRKKKKFSRKRKRRRTTSTPSRKVGFRRSGMRVTSMEYKAIDYYMPSVTQPLWLQNTDAPSLQPICITTANNLPTLFANCIPTQGTEIFNRVGRKILVKSLLCRFTVAFVDTPSLYALDGDTFRLMVVYDKAPNGQSVGNPTLSSVIGGNQAGIIANTGGIVTAPVNLNFRDRFEIITDKIINIAPPSSLSAVPTLSRTYKKTFKIYKRLNHEVIFSGPGTVNAGDIYGNGSTVDVNTGIFWIYLIATLPGNASQIQLLQFHSRYRFIDP